MVTQERWKPAVGFEGWYDVSNLGNVKRVKPGKGTIAGKILKPYTPTLGYCSVRLSTEGKQRTIAIHRLVMTTFVGPCPNGKEVNHMDGNKTNNHLENLEYITHSENEHHAYMTGLKSNHGENQSRNKLTEKNVHEIRRLLLKGKSQKSIAAQFDVSSSTINSIATGKNWAYLKKGEIVNCLPSYITIKEREESFATISTKDDTKRIIYRISTGKTIPSEDDLRSICLHIIKECSDYNAASFFFWPDGSPIGEVAALACLTSAPGGKWEAAHVEDRTNLAPMELVCDFYRYG